VLLDRGIDLKRFVEDRMGFWVCNFIIKSVIREHYPLTPMKHNLGITYY